MRLRPCVLCYTHCRDRPTDDLVSVVQAKERPPRGVEQRHAATRRSSRSLARPLVATDSPIQQSVGEIFVELVS